MKRSSGISLAILGLTGLAVGAQGTTGRYGGHRPQPSNPPRRSVYGQPYRGNYPGSVRRQRDEAYGSHGTYIGPKKGLYGKQYELKRFEWQARYALSACVMKRRPGTPCQLWMTVPRNHLRFSPSPKVRFDDL